MPNVEAGAIHRRNFTSEAFEQLTIDATAGGIALTSGTYGTNRYAYITVENNPIRYTTDGTPPTSSVGHVRTAGQEINLDSNEDIAAFRAIRTTGSSGLISVTYKELKLTA